MVCQADQYRSCNPGSLKHRLQSESGLTQTSVLAMHDIYFRVSKLHVQSKFTFNLQSCFLKYTKYSVCA